MPASGRIIALTIGQGTRLIRTGADGKVFFHRSDIEEGTSIYEFEPGDVVDFNFVEDPVSGARAVRVRRPVAISAGSHQRATP